MSAVKHSLDLLLREYEPGMKIPSERVLAEKFGIARMTLRHSLEALILEGKLERRPGSGTYMTNKRHSMSAQCRSFASEMKLRGLIPNNALVSRKVITADDILASKLRIPSKSKVLKFSRIRLGNEIPMAVQLSNVPMAYIGKITDEELESSLEDLLLQKFNIAITTSQTEIGGEFPNPRIASLLGISVGTPCLVKATIDIDQKFRTIMWNRTWYNAERFKIRFDSSCNVRLANSATAS